MSAQSSMPAPSKEEADFYERRWLALVLLASSLALIVIDSTIVNIAFPTIRSTFGASFADAEWVNSIYSLVFGSALITFGKLGDMYGRRNIFIAGAIVFLIGSAGSGLANSIETMVFFRGVQGLGGAMLSPSTLSIISSTFKGNERGIAFGVWGATAGVAGVLGPLLGGWLIEYGTTAFGEPWRLAFLINIPIGIIAVAGAFWVIKESRDAAVRHRIDVIGIVLASLGLGAIVFGAIEGQTYGWWEAKQVFTLGAFRYPNVADAAAIPAGTFSFIPFSFALGVILVAAFVIWQIVQERRGGEPLFEMSLFNYTSFRWGLLTVGIVALGEFGIILVLSIFFQLAKGLGAFETGLQLLPFAIAIMVAAPVAGVLASRFGGKWVVTAGMALETLGLIWLSRVISPDADTLTLSLPLAVYGVGIGLAIAQLSNIILSDVPPSRVGAASGANNTIRQVGASLGIAIIGAVLFGTFASEAKPRIDASPAFENFGARVAANPNLSQGEKLIGQGIAQFGDQAKAQIKAGLDANEGFDGNDADLIGTALSNLPPQAVAGLKMAGLDVTKPDVVDQIMADLAPDAAILSADIQHALAEGFAVAARADALLAAVFVGLGAIASLLLPVTKPGTQRAEVATVAH